MDSNEKPTEKRYRRNKQEMEDCVTDICNLLRQGYTLPSIRGVLLAQGLKKKTVQRAIKEAQDIIAALGNAPTDYQLGKLHSRLDYLYSHTSVGPKQDFNIALRAIDIQSRLLSKTNLKANQAEGMQHADQPHAQPDAISPRLAELFRNYQRQSAGDGSHHGPANA